jgi:hypothetical protein
VFKAEFARYRTMMEQYNAAMAVLHEFEEAIERTYLTAADESERLYAGLVRVYGAQDDGSVLLQLPTVGAFLVRPDDSMDVPPWMRPDAPSDDDDDEN